jgi:hypothetical protein
MKFYLSIFAMVLFQFGNAQCAANAGPDLYVCFSDTATVTLGGSPSANFGTPPYQYAWSMQPILGSSLTSAFFLNDSTLANPVLISPADNDTIHFYLTVTDSLGCISRDTVLVYGSTFLSGLGFISFTINRGDSVNLNRGHNVTGGLGAKTYLWRPNHGLRDSTNASPGWVKPDTSVNYYVTVTDETGCSATGLYYFIRVNQIGLKEPLASQIKVFPNPVREKLQVEIPVDLELNTLRLLDLTGRLVRALNSSGESHSLSDLPSGVYFVEAVFSNGEVFRQRVLKN